MRYRHLHCLLVLTIPLVVSEVCAKDPARLRVTKQDAATVVDRGGPHGRAGDVVRCADGQRVGVWVESVESVDLQDVTVEGCEVGIVVGRMPPSVASGDVQALTAAPATHTVTAAKVTNALVCIWLLGNSSINTGNVAEDCQYGFVVSGDGHVVEQNILRRHTRDGILVVGDGNTIAANQVEDSGRDGINVVGAVPELGKHAYVPALRDSANSNVIRDNVVLRSGRFDLRQWPVDCTLPPEDQPNTWMNNTARRRNAACLE